MEWKIGEIKQVNGEWYQCVPNKECNGCAFHGDEDKCCMTECSIIDRSDSTSVVFMKLEKVGEPFICNYYGDNRLIMMQEYNLYNLDDVTNEDKILMYITDYKHKRIAIEIKQNKENMEEKEEREIKLKTFDLEVAKAGKPVCTRDGRKARIICFDKKCLDGQILIVLVDCGKEECMYFYTTDGKCIDDFSSFDLMMLPEKKEGWVNVYKHFIYATKEDAQSNINPHAELIDTIKIEWEE